MWRRSTRTGFSGLASNFSATSDSNPKKPDTRRWRSVEAAKARTAGRQSLPDSCSCAIQTSHSRSRPHNSPRKCYSDLEGVRTQLPCHLIKFRQSKRSVMGLPVMPRADICMWHCPVRTIDPPAADGLRVGGPGRTRDYLLDQVRSTMTWSTHAAIVILGTGAVRNDRMVIMQGDEMESHDPFMSGNDESVSSMRDQRQSVHLNRNLALEA
jgi:hypothetical protein